MRTLTKTEFNFNGLKSLYHGKVRDVYTIYPDIENLNEEILVMVVTDRISAFDIVLPAGIPEKGQVLNQIASKFLDATKDIVPNWKLATPDPMVMVGRKAEPFMVEMVIRGYLTGHAWREYKSGKRTICGVPMPDGMVEHQKFPKPLITPTTKAIGQGHDEDISRDEIIANGLVSEKDYTELERISLALFERGTQMAAARGLILVDTKYEFGKIGDEIILIDEIHTPDSSRYFYSEGYEERLKNGQDQKQLSKEFVREWLMSKGFQGKEGQKMPFMPDDFVQSVSDRYIELYENITGEKYEKGKITYNLDDRVYSNIMSYLCKLIKD